MVFKVANKATKPEIKAAVEALFNVSVAGREHDEPEGQDQALEGQALQAFRRQEGDRDAWPKASRSTSPAGSEADHGTQELQPDQPRPARPDPRRQVVAVEGQAGQGADRRQDQDRRPQQQGPRHLARHRRRSQAEVPLHRLQASQVGPARHGRAARVRSQPHRVHRAGQVRGRRARLHPRAAASRRRRHRRRRREDRREAGQRDAAAARCRSARSSTTSR